MIQGTDKTVSDLYVQRQRRDELLFGAGRRRLPVVLTRYGGDGWMSYKSRFVACRPDQGNIYIEQPSGEPTDKRPILRVGEQIGISFRRGRTKCLFNTVVTESSPTRNAQEMNRNAVALRWPENLQEMQRRLYERVGPPPGGPIEVSFQPYDVNADESSQLDLRRINPVVPEPPDSSAAGVRQGVLENLSAGGLSVLVGHSSGLHAGDMLSCAFSLQAGGEPLQFAARLRHVRRAHDGRWSLGFQFVGLETSNAGQCRLAQLANIVSGFRRSRPTSSPR